MCCQDFFFLGYFCDSVEECAPQSKPINQLLPVNSLSFRLARMGIAGNLCLGFSYVIVTVLFVVSSVAGTACKDGYGLNYTLPMTDQCNPKEHLNGSMVQTIPKLVPSLSADGVCLIRRNNTLGIPPGHRVCRFPDCDKKLCENGWCEETMESFQCHCLAGFQGKHCSENIAAGTTAMSTTRIQSEPMTSEASLTTTTPSITDSPAKIFVSDRQSIYMADLREELVFKRILNSSWPRDVNYDPVSKKIYWSDFILQQVFRADVNGANREAVTGKPAKGLELYGIEIAGKSRTLYIAYKESHKITSLSIAHDVPGNEIDFIGVSKPRTIVADEAQGYLYFTMNYKVARASLSGEGRVESLVRRYDLFFMNGLSIDFTRNIRRIFFCDFSEKKSFYVDMDDKKELVDMTKYIDDGKGREKLVDVSYFNGVLYWLKSNVNEEGIGIMMDYDRSNRSYRVQTISQFTWPNRMHIAYVEP